MFENNDAFPCKALFLFFSFSLKSLFVWGFMRQRARTKPHKKSSAIAGALCRGDLGPKRLGPQPQTFKCLCFQVPNTLPFFYFVGFSSGCHIGTLEKGTGPQPFLACSSSSGSRRAPILRTSTPYIDCFISIIYVYWVRNFFYDVSMHVHKAAKWIRQVAVGGQPLHWPLRLINLTILTLNLLGGRKGFINLMGVEAHKAVSLMK